MQKLSSLITGAALTLTTGLLGCGVDDIDDPFDSLTTVANETTGDGDGDATTGDGDGDPTTTGDGDGDPTTTGDGDGDPTTGGDCGGFGQNCCDGNVCDDGLACDDVAGTCGLGGGDGDGDPTTGGDGDAWDPAACTAPSMVLMVGMLEGNFCSAPCMADLDCPLGPDGTQAACALTVEQGADPSYCALICQPAQDACPGGSSCKDLMDPMNPGLGICTYP